MYSCQKDIIDSTLNPQFTSHMPRQKLIRRAKLEEFPNVFDDPKENKGSWNKIFKNENPIILELACGKAEFAVEMAQKFPDKNIIGVDKKSDRIYIGAKRGLAEELSNLTFARCLIDHLDEYFAPGEVDEIWITFPDPHPKKGGAKKRLTSPRFQEIYKKVIKPGGSIHLKTDALNLHEYTKEVADTDEELRDLYAMDEMPELLQIQTTYEKRHLAEGRKIYYLRFKVN